MKFIERILQLKHLSNSHKVLDLGAGQGTQADIFTGWGFSVTAVDKNLPEVINSNVNWHQSTIEDFLENIPGQYDIIFARNILQFLDKEYVQKNVIPKLKQALNPNGIIAISTFYQDPKPAFSKPFKSYYTLAELQHYTNDLKVLFSKQYTEAGFDLKGKQRQFYISEIIIQKFVC